MFLVSFPPAVFVNLGYPQEVPCNVSHSPQGIIYRVPEFQAQACDYHWDNASVSSTPA